jgi:hypothetical protein
MVSPIIKVSVIGCCNAPEVDRQHRRDQTARASQACAIATSRRLVKEQVVAVFPDNTRFGVVFVGRFCDAQRKADSRVVECARCPLVARISFFSL